MVIVSDRLEQQWSDALPDGTGSGKELINTAGRDDSRERLVQNMRGTRYQIQGRPVHHIVADIDRFAEAVFGSQFLNRTSDHAAVEIATKNRDAVFVAGVGDINVGSTVDFVTGKIQAAAEFQVRRILQSQAQVD